MITDLKTVTNINIVTCLTFDTEVESISQLTIGIQSIFLELLDTFLECQVIVIDAFLALA